MMSRISPHLALWLVILASTHCLAKDPVSKADRTRSGAGSVTFPPALPDGQAVVTDTSDEFLKPGDNLKSGVLIAKAAPAVDFLFFPGQTYPGHPWSAWGDSLAANGKYYASIGDHLAPAGNGFVFEFDPESKSFRQLVDLRKVLNLPEGHYTPGKIHGRLDIGSDGWLYFSTHRGSPRVTTDQYHYLGDWILRCDPKTATTEIVAQGPVPKHCIPNSLLDPDRLIFYGGTAPGSGGGDDEGVQFFAYDVRNKKRLYAGPDGPPRAMMFARSTGRIYYVAGPADGPLMRFDPKTGGPPVKVEGSSIGVRAATQETPQGFVYTISLGQKAGEAELWSFNTKTEEIKKLGPSSVASQAYTASIDADPTGRYLYYVPGAHGGSDRDGSPVVQFDTKTGKKKVIAFLASLYQKKYGCALRGTFSTAINENGDRLYVTWNVSRGGRAWDCCALTVIHIPATERPSE